jgi:membrane-anchored mycosin MYCP
MGNRVGTARRGSVKAGAVVLAACFGAFAPGFGPLTAAAQEQPPAEEETPVWAPKSGIGSPPSDDGKSDKEFEQKVGCIESASTAGKAVEILKEAPWGQAHLRLTEVHELVRARSAHAKVGVDEKTGKPLKVAVIDTGVTKHPFFQDRLEGGGDYIEGGDGLNDCDGHGTQVAGIIAADPKNPVDIAFIGVAPDAKIVSIRQSSQNFSPKSEDQIAQEKKEKKEEAKRAREAAEAEQRAAEQAARLERLQKELEAEKQDDDKDDKTESSQDGGDERTQETPEGAGDLKTLAKAIMRAVDKEKVDVINMSVDACRPNDGTLQPTPDESAVRAAIKHAADENVVVVAAAGNLGGSCVENDKRTQADPRVPDPNNPRTIVTPPWFAADNTMLTVGAIDESGSVANFSMRGPWLSVAAPGTKIISTDPAPDSDKLVNVTFEKDKQVDLRGTSFAAPYVAGLAVLVKQTHSDLDAYEVIERIKATAQHPGAAGGHDQFIGHGVIDPMAAITAELPEEMGIEPAVDRNLPSDMPPLNEPDPAPVIVALAGTGGGLAALAITMFVVRSVRRKDRPAEPDA